MSSLAESFPKEQERLLNLLEQYREIGPSGVFGYAVIKDTLLRANVAMASGDVAAMLRAYTEMQGCQ